MPRTYDRMPEMNRFFIYDPNSITKNSSQIYTYFIPVIRISRVCTVFFSSASSSFLFVDCSHNNCKRRERRKREFIVDISHFYEWRVQFKVFFLLIKADFFFLSFVTVPFFLAVVLEQKTNLQTFIHIVCARVYCSRNSIFFFFCFLFFLIGMCI